MPRVPTAARDLLLSFRQALARRFLLKIKRATHRANPRPIEPDAASALVVAPHMDDEVIPCGGTLLRLVERGARVDVVFVSDSSTGARDPQVAANLVRVRRAEAARVAAFMGFASTHELGLPDSRLGEHEDAIAGRLEDLLRTLDPRWLLCPFPTDAHADHMAVAAATARAARQAGWTGEILAYEVWTPLIPNAVVDIGAVAERKAEAIRLYASQMDDRDYVAATLGLNRFRGLPHRLAHAEAFHRCDAAAFGRLTALLDAL
jgi:LmbE family N-acetylglucosaminyl deacetylase